MNKPTKIKPTRGMGKDPEDKETLDLEEWLDRHPRELEEWLEANITIKDQPLEHAGWERKHGDNVPGEGTGG